MSRGRRIGALGGGLVVVAAAVTAILLGVVGIEQTVSAGTQPEVCGVKIGVTVSGQTVRLLGASDESSHSAGDRVRVAALCVVEIVGIDNGEAGPDDDGAGARVKLRWRLW